MSYYITYSATDSLNDFIDVASKNDLIQLTDGSVSGEVNTTILDRSISAIQELIDAHLATITSVPLASAPKLIKRLHAQLVLDDLRLRRHKTRSMDQDTLYKRLIQQLTDMASGKIVIDTTPAITADDATVAVAEARTRMFTNSKLDDLMRG